MKDNNFKVLGIIILLGGLIIGGLMFVENSDVDSNVIVDEKANTNYKELENKILALKNSNFDPSSYNTIATEINSSSERELITLSAKTNLMTNLSQVYSELVLSRCEFYLTNNIGDSNEINNWLQQLENITAKNSKIDFYRTQIKSMNYYLTELPNKIDNFIDTGIYNFNEDTYKNYKSELQTFSRLNTKYKNNKKLSIIRDNYTTKLENFYSQYYSEGEEAEDY